MKFQIDPMSHKCSDCQVWKLSPLSCLNDSQLKRVNKEKNRLYIPKGATIFREGQKLNGVYCINSGFAKLSKLSENGKEQIVKIVGAGELLGKRSVAVNEKTNLCATAINDMQLCFIPKSNLIHGLESDPTFTMAVLEQALLNLKSSDDAILDLTQKNVKQRIAKLLLYLSNNVGSDKEGNISLYLSRADIANIVGAANETCIRTLKQLENSQLISANGRKIKILDKNSLNRLTISLESAS